MQWIQVTQTHVHSQWDISLTSISRDKRARDETLSYVAFRRPKQSLTLRGDKGYGQGLWRFPFDVIFRIFTLGKGRSTRTILKTHTIWDMSGIDLNALNKHVRNGLWCQNYERKIPPFQSRTPNTRSRIDGNQKYNRYVHICRIHTKQGLHLCCKQKYKLEMEQIWQD